MIDLLAVPFLACLVLTGIHAYFGLHVLARGVIFVDLALAQVAALGMTAALLAGHPATSDGAYYYALAFTAAGAGLFALSRGHRRAGSEAAVPQEAIIGIVYAVAAALTVLVLDRVPQGGEQIKHLLVGGILSITLDEVARVTALYATIGAAHWLCRRPLLALSRGVAVPAARAWDFFFYFTFGLVVTSSVRMAGVLLVFSYLVVPAVIGAWVAPNLGRRLAIGWVTGVLVSVIGLAISWRADLPTGATIVAAFGAVLLVVAAARAGSAFAAYARRDGRRAAARVGLAVGVVMAAAGAALAAFPAADHYWLDGLERLVPAVRTAFLSPGERVVFADSTAAVARGGAELSRLRGVQADAAWGSRPLDPDQRERLTQFLTGKDELVAGDRLVLGTLRARARERQRFVVGLPLAAAGAALALISLRVTRGSQLQPRG